MAKIWFRKGKNIMILQPRLKSWYSQGENYRMVCVNFTKGKEGGHENVEKLHIGLESALLKDLKEGE